MPDDDSSAGGQHGPLQALGTLAATEVSLGDDLDHLELYTRAGLLTLFWHGAAGNHQVVLMVGGAMGGLLGPGRGLYHQLGATFATQGIGTIRIGYRVPNDLDACVHDALAAAELAAARGARSFVTVGHSFGGAVAVQVAAALGDLAAGVVTLATQAGGCEVAEVLTCPVIHFHGDADPILPHMASELVQMISGGELVICEGAGHMLTEASDEIRERLLVWIPEQLAAHRLPTDGDA